MDNIEEMKNMWLELNDRITSLEEENRRLARQVINSNYKTAREKLIRKYSAFMFISLLMIVYIILLIVHNPLCVEKYKIPTLIYWCFFFLFEFLFDYYLREKIKAINIYHSSLEEIASLASRNWKLHKIAIAIGLPLAIGACVLFGLLLDANSFIIYGMVAGGLVGLIIGLYQLLKFQKFYRLLQSNDI